jgi:hypothetical protein
MDKDYTDVLTMKREFNSEYVSKTVEVKMNMGETTWPELMEEFAAFLRGCGYIVPFDFLKDEQDGE